MKLNRLLLVFAVLTYSSPGLAGRGGGGPCVEDARKLCAGKSAVGGHLQECLKQHQNELTPSCKAQYGAKVDTVKNAAGNVKDSCGGEVQKWCKGVSPMGLQQCIKDNSKNLSEGCRGGLDALKGSLLSK